MPQDERIRGGDSSLKRSQVQFFTPFVVDTQLILNLFMHTKIYKREKFQSDLRLK